MNTKPSEMENSFYAGIQSLRNEELSILLKKFGVKALASGTEDRISFAKAAISCGAMGMASEAVKGLDPLQEEIKIFLENGGVDPEGAKYSVFYPASCSPEIAIDSSRILVDGECSHCSGNVRIDLLKPRLGNSKFICPHCLTILEVDKKELRPFLEEMFVEHMRALEAKLRSKELSYQDCEHLVQLADSVFPWLKVRFGTLRSERIGHFAMNTEKYLSERAAGITDSETFDFLGHSEPVSNKFLKLMWNRVIRYSPVASVVAPLLSPESPYNTYKDLHGNNGRDDYKLWHRSEPFLKFTQKEEDMARSELARMGIEPGAEYVCLNVRDNAYLKSHLKGKDWSYHDFRDSDIDTYKDAALALAERGYYVLRMGAVTEKTFELDHPRVIDYSNYFRSEFMDVYLCGTCSFMISTGTGIDGISFIFRRPVLYVNYAQAGAVVDWDPNCITMFKRFFWIDGERELALREIFGHGVASLNKIEQLKELGVHMRNNSPKELMEACLEMAEFVEGGCVSSLSDNQVLANSIIRQHIGMIGRMAECYLEKMAI
ncbi:TIGR04372 family glycosyltransferase [Maridesulfovibrio sp. FT414]|uniref:TIGR04372 family glycosyltransferase n=1 Tax=Maridesulfovibrio sp. FT414 TaxID=2979469 RepID=UPI003D803164